MKYLLVNITAPSNQMLEDFFDNTVLKEIAFGSKLKTPTLSYSNVMIPYNIYSESDKMSIDEQILGRISSSIPIIDDIILSVNDSIFRHITNSNYLNSISVEVTMIIDLDSIGIIYTDGSSSRENVAGWGVCKLTEESANGVLDLFTNKTWSYQQYSGSADNSTNNIGELNGVKTALENFGDKKIQLIISDSIYSIKTFREYIYTWKNNGWKTYNKKPIKNKDLIQEIYEKLTDCQKNKIVLFKWVKGHSDDNFNEICDQLAKTASGVSK